MEKNMAIFNSLYTRTQERHAIYVPARNKGIIYTETKWVYLMQPTDLASLPQLIFIGGGAQINQKGNQVLQF